MSIFTIKNNVAKCVLGTDKYIPRFQPTKYNRTTGFTRFLANKNTQIPPSFLIDGLNDGSQVQVQARSVYKKQSLFVYLGAFVFIGIMAWRHYRCYSSLLIESA